MGPMLRNRLQLARLSPGEQTKAKHLRVAFLKPGATRRNGAGPSDRAESPAVHLGRERFTPDLGLELSRTADDRKLIELLGGEAPAFGGWAAISGRPGSKSDRLARHATEAMEATRSIVYSIPQFFKNPGNTMGSRRGKITSTAGRDRHPQLAWKLLF